MRYTATLIYNTKTKVISHISKTEADNLISDATYLEGWGVWLSYDGTHYIIIDNEEN